MPLHLRSKELALTLIFESLLELNGTKYMYLSLIPDCRMMPIKIR